MILFHGTCVLVGDTGVLLRGPSGCGKSDLALRLVAEGARLVADDQVEIARDGDVLLARPPATIAGLIEVRGIGIVPMAPASPARVGLLIDLVAPDAVDRLPEDLTEEIAGLRLRRFALYPWECSATAKVRLAVQVATGTIMLTS